jgi:hypothetical protein
MFSGSSTPESHHELGAAASERPSDADHAMPTWRRADLQTPGMAVNDRLRSWSCLVP